MYIEDRYPGTAVIFNAYSFLLLYPIDDEYYMTLLWSTIYTTIPSKQFAFIKILCTTRDNNGRTTTCGVYLSCKFKVE